MCFHKRFQIVFIVILASILSVGLAEEPVAVSDSNETVDLTFPYFARITGDDVYIRSGPGTNYYYCGKANKDDIVKVISKQFTWSRILPPKGSFSWISKQYVVIDSANPDFGIVTGDNVRVYAGSPFREPIHSEIVQLKLDKNDKVKLMGEESGDYYKIIPPDSAYLWVYTEYTKPISVKNVDVEPIKVIEVNEPKIKTESEAKAPEVVPTRIPSKSVKLNEYYDLQDKIKVQQAKPLHEQDYSAIKEELAKIAEDTKNKKAARYAEFTLKTVERFELAAAVDKQAKQQDMQLMEIYGRIEDAHAKKLSKFQDLGKFAVIGKFQVSNVYGPEAVLLHYLIADDEGKVVCYALPSGIVSMIELDGFINEKVGLIGTIEQHPQTAGALVRFTGIERIK